ncbi:hypothetical protein TNCT_361111 [Trichonephila clavata]|uniref:Uncharacterized protein n=1 Tax=Trichonephila clavata TaxID=2740835 RepID=A0A8X6LAF9_TRICU|nr:hypothetical protein TNCT_361111 [Trichonephila clavata]
MSSTNFPCSKYTPIFLSSTSIITTLLRFTLLNSFFTWKNCLLASASPPLWAFFPNFKEVHNIKSRYAEQQTKTHPPTQKEFSLLEAPKEHKSLLPSSKTKIAGDNPLFSPDEKGEPFSHEDRDATNRWRPDLF